MERCVQKIKKGCFYFLYSLVKRGFARLFGPLHGRYGANLAVGYVAALLNTLPILPFETVSLRVITSADRHGPLRVAADLWRADGIRGFYRGAGNYPVLSLKPAVQETVIDQTALLFSRRGWPRRQGRGQGGAGLAGGGPPSAWAKAGGFALGFWGRSVTTVLLYPFFNVQTKVQTGRCRTHTHGEQARAQQPHWHCTRGTHPWGTPNPNHSGAPSTAAPTTAAP